MRTLYVSDLDGTLIRRDERTSDITNRTINSLVDRGMLFSYATARSSYTARNVTKGLTAAIPIIVYNGALIMEKAAGRVLHGNFFGEAAVSLIDDLTSAGVYPIVYSFIGGAEKFSFIPDKITPECLSFIMTRIPDVRYDPVYTVPALTRGDVFYIACIGDGEKLDMMYAKYRDIFRCVRQDDIYSGDPWLEIMPLTASKSNAAVQLKEMLGCDRLVAFGDGINDIDLFMAADEAYAVENAVPELKKHATAVIPSNEDDGVARWLIENFRG